MKTNMQTRSNLMVWGMFAVVLIIAPRIFNDGAAINFLSIMGTVMIFGLAYNMLLGQGGMLSFGHAVYSGLGAFGSVYVMNWGAEGDFHVPVTLVPLIGGLAGMFFGILFGYVTTKSAGVVFAMITLGIVELVFASTMMLPGIFGGEGGITTNRVVGEPFLGITYGPQIEVYYLVAFWLFVSAIAMYAYTRTPLGKLSNAVRDNPERVEFIGFSTHWVRYLTLILSSFFAGISGALSAINFEIVSSENVSIVASGSILLFTFIGGTGFFFGPMIGAVVGTVLTVMLSGYTAAWQLYLGVFFILVVLFAPGGIASLIMKLCRVMQFGQFGRLWKVLLLYCLMLLITGLGAVITVEMLYHITLNSANGYEMKLFGVLTDTASLNSWLVALILLSVGSIGIWRTLPVYRSVLDAINLDIDNAAQGANA